MIAGRISYFLGLNGPSIAVNTACSSSLVAVHLAIQSLLSGESAVALAGGVNLIVSPHSTEAMARFGGLSPGGTCRAFDAGADGYVRGEGGGLVVLKTLSRALVEGDPIRCVIRGTAVNNDGFSNGLTAPNPAAQESVIRTALARARLSPLRVDYVEAHGTGTRLGDPIEAAALGAVLGAFRPADRPLLVGSVKTNVGHTEAAAGIAGLIKTTLAVSRRIVPGNLHFDAPNPRIPFDELRLAVPVRAVPWPATGRPAVAGVSSFGFSGTNCHVVIEGPPLPEGRPLVFVFSGNGSQWVGMGRDLVAAEPAFREAIAECDSLFSPLGRWSILDELVGGDDAARLDRIDVHQPVIFAFQVALARLWRSWGVVPDVVIGHSLGEVAAGHLSGALSLEQAISVVFHRSRLQQRVAGHGAMVAVTLPADRVRRLVEDDPELTVAVVLSPLTTVLSGSAEAIGALLDRPEAREGRAVRVKVDVAYHSPRMDPLAAELAGLLTGLAPTDSRIPFLSTVTAGPVSGSGLDGRYWARNLRDPVLFGPAIESLLRGPGPIFLELGPHPLLSRSIRECLAHHRVQAEVLEPPRRLEEAHRRLRSAAVRLGQAGRPVRASPGPPAAVLVPLSAHSATALGWCARRLETAVSLPEAPDLEDLAHTLCLGRTHLAHRSAVVAASIDELGEKLRALVDGQQRPGLAVATAGTARRAAPVFVFPGQGSQWLGMGRRLLVTEPVFRGALERCDRHVRRLTGRSLLDELTADEARSSLGAIDVVQPLLFGIQVALVELWRWWDVRPSAVVGHSIGEVTAAWAAGVIDLADAALIVCRRSALLARVSGQGGMLMVELPPDRAREFAAAWPGRLDVAAVNGPTSTVLSGDLGALDEASRLLDRQTVFNRRVNVDIAAHSSQMDPLCGELEQAVRPVRSNPPTVPFYSSVTGLGLDRAGIGAAHWTANLRLPVLFWPAIEALLEAGHRTFVEISAHPVLLPAISSGARQRQVELTLLASMRRGEDDRAVALESLGALHCAGFAVNLGRTGAAAGRPVRLPTYPWQRERHWIDGPDDASCHGERTRSDPGEAMPDRDAPGLGPAGAGELVGQGGVAELYDAIAAVNAREPGYRQSRFDQAYLTFGLIAPGTPRFSWSRGLFFPSRHPDDHRTLREAQAQLRRRLFDQVDLGAVHRVVDVGCGTGADLVELAGRHPHLVLDGYTLSGRQASIGRSLAAGRGLDDRVRIFQRDSSADELPDRYDLACSFEVLGLVRDKAALLANLARHLNPGGRVLVCDFVANTASAIELSDASTFTPTPDELARVTAERGFRVLGVRDVSESVARFLDDSRVGETLAELSSTVESATALRHLRSWDNIGKALTQGLLSYVLVTLQRDPYGSPGELLEANAGALGRRAAGPEDAVDRLFHQLAWLPGTPRVAGAPAGGATRRSFVVVCDRGAGGDALCDALRHLGHRALPVLAVDDDRELERLVSDAVTSGDVTVDGVVLGRLDGSAAEPLDGAGALALATRLCGSAAATARALTAGRQPWPRLWLVTRGAQTADAAPAPWGPVQAPLLGLGRAIALEHPALRCTRVDLDPGAPTALADLAEELVADRPECEIALRGHERLVATIVRAGLATGADRSGAWQQPFRPDATYLITGGLGGVGLELARWMVSRGARHLVLTGRQEPAPTVRAAIEAIERTGARVLVTLADVCSLDRMSSLMERLDREWPPLKGVFHAAGHLEDSTVAGLDRAMLLRLLGPKLEGALNLHRLTRDRALDLFVLLSSAVALTGSPGQGGYAAANAALDLVAHHRVASGLPAVSVAFGPWADVGMTSRALGDGRRPEVPGMAALAPETALEALGRALRSRRPCVAVMELDADRWVERYPQSTRASLFGELLSRPRAAEPSRPVREPARAEAVTRRSLLALAPEARLAAIEKYLCQQAARVLRMPVTRVEPGCPLARLGLDSLMGVELRNRVESDLGLAVPLATLFDGSSLDQIASRMVDDLDRAAPATTWEEGQL
ncbi:MAG: SDR family NAD(P)-dependent oxidoreductase [Candidatus Riflebacteria bacterium]|nr:SDR family NAD(P)-dependent oxidoreductase [Candidatus Riflebacteria bacterium]